MLDNLHRKRRKPPRPLKRMSFFMGIALVLVGYVILSQTPDRKDMRTTQRAGIILSPAPGNSGKTSDRIGIILSQTPESDTAKIDALNELSTINRKISKYDTALYYAKKALEITDRQKTIYKIGRAKAFTNIGNVHNITGNWPESLTNYFACLKIAEEIKEKRGIAICYSNIGNIYYYLGNYKEALKNHMACLSIRKELKDKKGTALCYNNIAGVYVNAEMYDDALKNFMEALEILQTDTALLADKGYKHSLALNYQGLGNIYYYKNNFGEALKYYEATLKLQEEDGDRQGIAASFVNIGGAMFKLKKLNEALKYCLKGMTLARDLEVLGTLLEANEMLSWIYEEMAMKGGGQKDYCKSLEYFKAFIAIRDSLKSEENTKKMVRLEMNYEFDKKEAAAKLDQEKKEAVAAAESKKQRIVLILVSCVLLLVFVFAVFAYRSFLQKQKANIEITKQKETIEEKQKEILDSIHYAKRIQTALITSENYIAKKLRKLNEE